MNIIKKLQILKINNTEKAASETQNFESLFSSLPKGDLLKNFLGTIDSGILEIALTKIKIFNLSGALQPVDELSNFAKSVIPQNFAYGEQTRIAIDVANQYPGGDYFEFGSEGLNTLCNMLVAFHLNGHEKNFPDTRFFAFDVFGDPKQNAELSSLEKTYFGVHTRQSTFKSYYEEMQEKLKSFGLIQRRVELIKGYFKETLNDEFKSRIKKENRKIGFAFLDCNIAPSYQTALDFLEEFLQPEQCFIYLDEYFQNSEVPKIFKNFCANVNKKYGLTHYYVRTAGSFGALFKLMK